MNIGRFGLEGSPSGANNIRKSIRFNTVSGLSLIYACWDDLKGEGRKEDL